MLRATRVLFLDCQASGATPAHGDLLELGWALGGAAELSVGVRAHWIRPSEGTEVSRAVRKLTGWSDACLADALEPAAAWEMLRGDTGLAAPMPTVIHFARFELPFLRALHAESGTGPFPLDAICLHAVAQRLFPDLPRRNLRALAGYLGHSPELMRRSAGHVEATAFIWGALIGVLEERGVETWEDLKRWLEQPASRGRTGRRGFPITVEQRRALPAEPGVYRFLRPNGDVLYVGKAANLKKRVSSHFTAGSRSTERALEMLSQAHTVEVTTTATTLEAALLETDEIKRLDPPYNVQLRVADRSAWFASRDWTRAVSVPDEEHRVGPLPSEGALRSLAAVRRLLEGAVAADGLRAAAVGVPAMFAPSVEVFERGWQAFVVAHLGGERSARARILAASSRIVLTEKEEEDDAESPAIWDDASVVRYLERTVVHGGQLVRRARALSLLTNALVAFREPSSERIRLLDVAGGEIAGRRDLETVSLEALSGSRPPPRHQRQLGFDATRYDRLRVLSTELRRIRDQGGEAVIRIGARSL